MRLFLYLLLGQLVGDFVLQSSEMVRLKRVKLYGVYPHVALVVLATLVAVAGSMSAVYTALVMGLVAAFHLLLDRLSIIAFAETKVRQVFIFLADQAAHVAVLAGLALAVTRYGGTPIRQAWALPFDDFSVALLTGALAATFAGSIFVFETEEAFAPADPGRGEGAILGYSRTRILGMLERAALYLSAVYGLYPVTGVLLAARGVWTATRPAQERGRTVAETVATVALLAFLVAVTVGVRGRLAGQGQ